MPLALGSAHMVRAPWQPPGCGVSLSPVSAPLSARTEGRRPLPAQSESEQRPHNCDAKGAEAEALIKQLEERLAAAGVRAKVPQSLVIGLIWDV